MSSTNGKSNGKNVNGTHRRNTDGLMPPWPKGVSGNPNGRKGRTLEEKVRTFLRKESSRGCSNEDKLAQAWVRAAIKNPNGQAARELMARIYPATNIIDLTTRKAQPEEANLFLERLREVPTLEA